MKLSKPQMPRTSRGTSLSEGHHSLGKMGHIKTSPSLGSGGGLRARKSKKKKIRADVGGEPMVGNMSHAHIDPITWFQPPSGKLKKPVPTDNPRETDDKYLDVTKRKQAQKQRMDLLKRSTPGGNPPMIPVRTTAMESPSGVYSPLMSAADKRYRIKVRPARTMGMKRTLIRLPR